VKVIRIFSYVKPERLLQLLPEHAVILDAKKVHSMEELELAEILAKDAFRRHRNIAKKFRYEFLLWLAGKTDIKSALEFLSPKGREMLLVILNSGEKIIAQKNLLKKLNAIRKPARLKRRAKPLDLERISLSRIRSN